MVLILSSRFCLSETSCAQEDNYPSGLCIKVNGKLFPLPVSCSRLRWLKFRKNAASNLPTKPFPPAGLRTTTKKRRRTEETWKASEHYLPRPSLLCSTQSDFSHMGAWNWKSKNTIFLWILPLFFFLFFFWLNLKCSRRDPVCLADLFHVCVLGEAADVTTAPAEATDEGHQKPWPLQSTK